MGDAVEQRGRHFGVAKHRWPFPERQVGGDDDTGLLVELGCRRGMCWKWP